jgi:hypothetical protein
MIHLNFYQECKRCKALTPILLEIPATNETRIHAHAFLSFSCPACHFRECVLLVQSSWAEMIVAVAVGEDVGSPTFLEELEKRYQMFQEKEERLIRFQEEKSGEQ